MRKKLASFGFVMVSLVSATSFAWDGTHMGKKISMVEFSTSNYHLRLRLEGSPALCASTAIWAYLNETDENFKAISAAVLSAKALNQSINLYTTKDATTGYCKIGYFAVL
ncbi:MAG: hypothetical protein ACAH59_03375 [Pseudobdellovibrionaceae bacterium]